MTPADGEHSTRRVHLARVLFAVKLVVPVVLLCIIFRQIDVDVLCEHFKRVRATYFVAGAVGGVISQVFVAAYRWRYMLDRGYSLKLPYGFLLRQYWIGMFLGHFVPAGIGVDAYRIAAVYRRAGKLGANVAVIIAEKLFGVAGVVLIVAATYPLLVSRMVCSANLVRCMNWLYPVALGAIAAAIAIYALGRKRPLDPANASPTCKVCALFQRAARLFLRLAADWSTRFASMTDAVASRLFSSVDRTLVKDGARSEPVSFEQHPAPAARLPAWRYVAVIMLLTVLIRGLAAAGVYCFFMSLGHEVPITVTLFAFSLIILVFMLPISFGGLGVREGAYIVLFGLFGVPREVALAASFLALAALLATISIGGLILLGSVVWPGGE